MIKLFLILLAIIPINIFATDWEYSLEEKQPSANMEVEQVKFYKYYEERYLYTDNYYLEGENPKNYPFISDIIQSKKVYNLLEEPQQIPNRIITSRNVVGYKRLDKIKRINIRNFKSEASNRYLNISEIEVYNKDKKISYRTNCSDCVSFIESGFNNGVDNETIGNLKYDSVIDLYLDEEVYPEDLIIVFSIKSTNKFNFSFKIRYYNNKVTGYFGYLENHPKLDYIITNIEDNTNNIKAENHNIIKLRRGIEEDDIINYNYEDKIYLEEDDNYLCTSVDNVKVYDYEDIYFKYYKKEINYLKGYYLDMPDYIKDENDYIIKYKYRKIEQEEKEKDEKEENNDKDICIIDKTNKKDEKKEEEKKNVTTISTILSKIDDKKPEAIRKISIFRYISIAIIICVLALMVYTLNSLRKEK